MVERGDNKRGIYRKEKMIIDAGVSLVLTEANVLLPKLIIDWDYVRYMNANNIGEL